MNSLLEIIGGGEILAISMVQYYVAIYILSLFSRCDRTTRVYMQR